MKPRLALLALAVVLAAPVADARPRTPGLRLALAYDGVLLVKVLDMKIEQQIGEDDFAATARLRSAGVLSVFKKIDVTARAMGRFEGETARPAAFDHVNQDGKLNRRVAVRWGGADVATSAAPAYHHMGEPPPTPAQKIAAADPLTQLTRLALAAPDKGPCGRSARFFDGRQLYQVDFGAPAPRTPGRREAALGLEGPIACTLTFNEIAGFDAKPPEKKNQGLNRPMSIEFARLPGDGPWAVTTVRGKTPLGEARIELTSAQISG